MKVCSGQIRYLVAILELSKGTKNVRGVDVARFLEVTKPSVTKMLKCLADSNLIEEVFTFGIRLTEEGREVATRFHSQYEYVYVFFLEMLKLPEKESREQSLEFVSSFPMETLTRFTAIVKKTMDRRRMKARS